MRRPPPKSTRTDPLVPYTPLFRSLPPLPEVHDLRWIAGAPSRRRAKGISDAASAALATEMRPFIKADDGASAEALLDQTQGLTPEATTEWRQRSEEHTSALHSLMRISYAVFCFTTTKTISI